MQDVAREVSFDLVNLSVSHQTALVLHLLVRVVYTDGQIVSVHQCLGFRVCMFREVSFVIL